MFTRDRKMIEIARSKPWEVDVHTDNASHIFRVPMKEVDGKKRYFGKKGMHAYARGMAPKRMSDELLKEGYAFSIEECAKILEGCRSRYAPIEDNYFPDIRRQLLLNRCLVSTWSDVWECWFVRLLSDDLFREAYSFLPQCETARLTNEWGLKPTWHYLRREKPWCRINTTVHDSLLSSVKPEDAYDVALCIGTHIERPRTYYGQELIVPVTYKLGMNWGFDEKRLEGHEFKRLPSRKEFTLVAYEMDERMKKSDGAS